MLEGALHFLDVIGATADVNLGVLWVLDGESIAGTFVVALPSAMALLEVFTALSYRQSNVFVVELSAIEFEEINQVLA